MPLSWGGHEAPYHPPPDELLLAEGVPHDASWYEKLWKAPLEPPPLLPPEAPRTHTPPSLHGMPWSDGRQ
jgi:hypothetical protein